MAREGKSGNPLQDVTEKAQAILSDAEELLKAAGDAVTRVMAEGTALTHEAVQSGLDAIAEANNRLGQAAQKLATLRESAPKVEDDETAPPVPAEAPEAPQG